MNFDLLTIESSIISVPTSMAALFSPYAPVSHHHVPLTSPGDMRYRNPDLLTATSSLTASNNASSARTHTTYASHWPSPMPSSPPFDKFLMNISCV